VFSLFCIQIVTSAVLKGHVQGALNHYLLFRLLNALGIDACLQRDTLKGIEDYLHKLVAQLE
jgi:hypothetical protein